ncbi:MAG: DUF1080 domain-containing protein [Planctomycetes bacterium]|nr:DUF1080 domain-containing protein [Planctomycetota bacterium]
MRKIIDTLVVMSWLVVASPVFSSDAFPELLGTLTRDQAPAAPPLPGPTPKEAPPKPEPVWRTLFDGTSTAEWRGYRRDGFPEKGWQVDEGTLHVVKGGGGGDIVTKDRFADFELELEWRVSEPNANSGIIYRVSEEAGASYETGPEMQVLGDPELSDKSTSAGGLYALYDTVGKKLNPIGEWNQARVVVRGHHVEHWLNGARIVQCEMHSPDWYARVAKSKFAGMPLFGTVGRGHIALQDHGNDVWYRNIRIRDLSLVPTPWVDLFNGRDLEGWSVFSDGADADGTWRVDNGVLICRGLPKGYLRTDRTYTNFCLELEWRWPAEPGNSGVLLRVEGEDRIWPRCVEAQLKSGSAGDFYAMGGAPLKADPARVDPERPQHVRHRGACEKPAGEWNRYRILVNGGKVELEINGVLANEGWECAEVPGRIALQSEGAEIHFRHIRLSSPAH